MPVEIIIDNGIDFTYGSFPEGFRAKDLAQKLASLVPGLQSIRITTPRFNKGTTFTYDFRGLRNTQKWGYTYQVSEYIIRNSGMGMTYTLREGEQPRKLVNLDEVATVIARDVNAAIDKWWDSYQGVQDAVDEYADDYSGLVIPDDDEEQDATT
jgi:hypothetical protein